MLCFSERVIVDNLLLVITGIHLDVPFTKEGNCKLGSKCAFKQTEKAGSEPKKRNNSVVLAKTLDHTQSEEQITEIQSEGAFLHGVSAIPVTSIVAGKIWEYCQQVPTGSRRRTTCDRARQARSDLGNYTFNKVDTAVEVRMLRRASKSEVVQSLLKQTWNLPARKHGSCTRTLLVSKGLLFSHVKHSLRHSNRSTQETVVASRSDSEHEDREFIVDSGASLHMMSQNELTSGENDTVRRSKEPTVIATANGEAELTEEATENVHDMEVSVTHGL